MKISLGLQGILLSAAILGSVADRRHFRKDIRFLLYDRYSSLEKDPESSLNFFKDRSSASGIRTTVYGGTLKDSGSGDKLRLLKPILEVANSNELIVVADAREVLLNVPEDPEAASEAVDAFLHHFHQLTEDRPNAVVVSAEEHCCSAAMSHSSPGDFFIDSMERNYRACSAGDEDCEWEKDNERLDAWKESMREMALDETHGNEEYNNVFLNSGILAGYPKNLMEVLRVSDINSSEDDRAVLTDLMLAAPDMIMLDYHQELFGNNPVHKGLEEGCVFERESSTSPLVHAEHMTKPLILHTPNRFYDCLDTLIEAMGGVSQQRYLQNFGSGETGMERRLAAFPDEQRRKLPTYYIPTDQYGNYGYGVLMFWSQQEIYDMFFGPYGVFNYGNYGQYGNYGYYSYYTSLLSYLVSGIPGMDMTGQYGFWHFNYGNYGSYLSNNEFRRGLTGSAVEEEVDSLFHMVWNFVYGIFSFLCQLW